ncbi:MAG: hypothetical protein ACRDPJ_19285 [Nocardioidaceae bacterium]
MTGLLKSVMREHADSATPPQPDLDAIVTAGDRRTRRTRMAAGLGVAAVVTAAVAVPSALTLDRATDAPVASTQGAEQGVYADRLPTYSLGSVIHYGGTTVDVHDQVASFVQTDDGFVYATKNGEVHFADGRTTEKIGRTSTDGLYLKADDSGSTVAWVEFPEGEAPEFVVYDTGMRAEVLRTSQGNTAGMTSFRDTDAAYIFGVDGDDVYWRSGDGLVRYDLQTGESEVLSADANPFDVSDVANGHIAHLIRRDGGEASALRVSTDLNEPAKPLPSGWNGYLSPDATYIAVDQADEMAVYDVATHEDVSPDTQGYAFVAGYAWLDDRTVMMIGMEKPEKSEPIDILRCSVPSGTCEVVEDDVAVFDDDSAVSDLGLLSLPVGETVG